MDSAEQQIVDSINATSNILVTVSNDPSVDELTAALGLTLVLDQLDKRATAIFSGTVPPAITFLEPDKTFEDTANSLRDFIIALNKEKADHLRYKVDGDVVKIFITPYKTALSQSDLEFSQGDYNIETIIALGVQDQDHLDKALDAHGKILHDAKVLTITAGADKSSLGAADWHDDKASSLSEMVVSLVNALGGDKSLLGKQTATALLTGIVAATDRFSNDKTSSQVMTLAAQLMAAGANQQLIASKLQESHEIGNSAPIATKETDSSTDATSDDATQLTIDRKEKTAEAKEPATEASDVSIADLTDDDTKQAELEKQLAELTAPATGTMADIEQELKAAPAPEQPAEPAAPESDTPEIEVPADEPEPPVTDATPLTAPTDATMPGFEPTEAATPADAAQPLIQNHDGNPAAITPPADAPALNGQALDQQEEQPTIDPFNTTGVEPVQQGTTIEPVPAPAVGTPEGAAILAAPVTPEPVLTPPPAAPQLEVPDPMTVFTSAPPAPQPEIPELPPLPPLPTIPGDASLPPLPPPPPLPPAFPAPSAGGAMPAGAVSGDIFGDGGSPAAPASETPAAPVPGQFKIPGQS